MDIPYFQIVVIGAGATGLCAALAGVDRGAEVLVLERDAVPQGSTAMSTGLIPASGTAEQAAAGIADSPERFAADMRTKTQDQADPAMTLRLAQESAGTVAWLRDTHGVPLALIDGFLYPGHSAQRMYGTPNRTGGELMAALLEACAAADVPILTHATVEQLVHADDRVTGVRFSRPDGTREEVSCDALILACSGFGGNADMVGRFIPEMAEATYHGHPGNTGDAIRWGGELGAALADMQAYQGHGGLAAGHGVPILWPLIMEGGFQVNATGHRFSDESSGYSEQAARVNAQPGHVAWSIFDARLDRLMRDFDDYRDALSAGAVISAPTITDLAQRAKLPAEHLAATCAEVADLCKRSGSDRFGRTFRPEHRLAPPFHAAKVTGALFHTQGGLVVDGDARVIGVDGRTFPNLFAGGGAARGVSGCGASGYLAGNGLLTATTLGRLAGQVAADDVTSGQHTG